MIRLAQWASLLFRLVIWLFTAVTIADAANLDDLLADTVVLHDDQDTESQPALVADNTPKTGNNAATNSPRHESRQAPVAPVCVVYDQDSPSLAADPAPLEALVAVAPTEEPAAPQTSRISCESLHVRLCSLLL